MSVDTEVRQRVTETSVVWRDPVADAAPEEQTRRQLRGLQERDVLPLVGAAAAAFGITSLLYFVLLPWSGLLGFLALDVALFLLVYGVLVSAEGSVFVADRIAATLAQLVGLTMLVALVSVVVFTFVRGFDALRHPASFLLDDLADTGPLDPLTQGGVLHAIAGTLIMIAIALVLTVPLGLVCAVYLSETRGGFARFVRTIVEAMTALPSVIAGLAVYAGIILLQEKLGVGQKSALAASIAISIEMLPIMIRAADVVLRLVPGTLKEAALALGAPRWRVAWHVVMPTARSGLLTAIILGTARGIGETAPVLLTAGYTAGLNLDPTSGPMVNLPLATFVLTRSPEPTQIARGFGSAAVLLLLVLVLFGTARILGGRGPGQLSNRQRRRLADASRRDLARFGLPAQPPAAVARPLHVPSPPGGSDR